MHLSSALIERRSRIWQTVPYALVQGQYRAPKGPMLAGEVRVYDLGAAEVRLGVMQAF